MAHALSEGAESARALSGTTSALGFVAQLNITLDEPASSGVIGEVLAHPALPDRWNPSGKISHMTIRFQQRRRPVILKDALRIKRIANGAESIEPGVERGQLVCFQWADFAPVRARMEQS